MQPKKSQKTKRQKIVTQEIDHDSQTSITTIELTNQELFQLVHHHEKFVSTVTSYIEIAQYKIEHSRASEAISYLVQAEKILQYAASCGKNIDRKIIMNVLHNQAYAYQRIWQLPKCSNYLEGLIYNLNQKMVSQPSQSSSVIKPNDSEQSFHLNGNDSIYLGRNQYETGVIQSDKVMLPGTSKLDIGQKLRLIKYHLQYSAVNSQLKNHKKSLQSALKTLKYLRQLFAYSQKTARILDEGYCCEVNSRQPRIDSLLIKQILDNLQRTYDQPQIELYDSYVEVCQSLYSAWEFRQTIFDFTIKEEIKKITIGSIMQIKSYKKQLQETQQFKMVNSDYLIESSENRLTYDHILYFIILMCISYFTLATQMRLKAITAMQTENDDSYAAKGGKYNKNSHKYLEKEAQIYHIICMCLYFIYVPAPTDFLEHIINSYRNHYSSGIKQMFQKKSMSQQIHENLKTPQGKNHKYSEQNLKVLQFLDPLWVSQWNYSDHRQAITTSKGRSLQDSRISPVKDLNSTSKKKKKNQKKSYLFPQNSELKISTKIKQNNRKNLNTQSMKDSPKTKQITSLQKKYKKLLIQKYVEQKPRQKKIEIKSAQKSLNQLSFSGSHKKIGLSSFRNGKSVKNSKKKSENLSREKNSKYSKAYILSADYKVLNALDESGDKTDKHRAGQIKKKKNEAEKKYSNKNINRSNSRQSGKSYPKGILLPCSQAKKIKKGKGQKQKINSVPDQEYSSPGPYYQLAHSPRHKTKGELPHKQINKKIKNKDYCL